jgi:DNA recombination protein RmuC
LLLKPLERGKLGNLQLEYLLSLYLPKNKDIFQMEYTLKKKTKRGDGLRVDAIIFGLDKKGNLAIDSKFPLDNYSSIEDVSKFEKEAKIKKFKENLKAHIKKVSEYLSEEDDIEHSVMFVPSELIFAKINEEDYHDIIDFALKKKVFLCSPTTLLIIVNQVL